ncbi:MAG: DUF4838 domain-containing protein, partial [Pirellulaceae bacterium]|nr:DUF4838 domain-containing protein [Pirellulaceae bacterium]
MWFVSLAAVGYAQRAGSKVGNDLTISPNGPKPLIVVSSDAGLNERNAAADLAVYIDRMCGVAVETQQTSAVQPAGDDARRRVVFYVGQAALQADPSLRQAVANVAKEQPVLRADAIVVKRRDHRVYLAGSNDESHYHAVSRLLQLWGCRWYLPTEFGECIPEYDRLSIGELDEVYAPPFEVRRYWVSWNGDRSGEEQFKLRNYMNSAFVPSGHILATYVKDLVPEGKSVFNIPIADPQTAEHVAKQVLERFGQGEHIQMGMEDGTYTSEFALDNELKAGLFDKYFQTSVLTDSFMLFYNNLAERLLEAHPNSQAKIGFLAYVNLTIPPQRDIIAAKPLIAYLAPIDIDPTHSIIDLRSPPKREYGQVMRRWSHVMQGRVVIYDYDQGMLVWRDIPNPSHMAFREDVKQYRDAGILGVDSECRAAFATVFTNMFFRGQLLWNPDADVDALLTEFYEKFYGPASQPMRDYWTAIYQAWENTVVTEHEYFVIPSIYTPELVERLRQFLVDAESLVGGLRAKSADAVSRNEKLWLDRMRFTRLSFGILENYVAMITAANRDVDYKKAHAHGAVCLALREELTRMNGVFTTYRYADQPGTKIVENGPAWFSGEVQQYADLAEFTAGPQGKLITKLPLEWSFRRDPHDTGLAKHFAGEQPDLSFWQTHQKEFAAPARRKDYPTTEWEVLRTDLYPQAQGVLHPDWQSFTGYMWSKTNVTLEPEQVQGRIHLRFPGLFADGWLYVNGFLVAYRKQNPMWWNNDY